MEGVQEKEQNYQKLESSGYIYVADSMGRALASLTW